MTDDTKRAIEAAKGLLAACEKGGRSARGQPHPWSAVDALRTALSALDRPTEETSNSAEALARKVQRQIFADHNLRWPDHYAEMVQKRVAQALVAYRATGVRERDEQMRPVMDLLRHQVDYEGIDLGCYPGVEELLSTTPRREAMSKWNVGDRVTRERNMDDGTWAREGDDCLPGPLRHGEVTAIIHEEIIPMYRVRWDDGGPALQYFGHGIDAEVAP